MSSRGKIVANISCQYYVCVTLSPVHFPTPSTPRVTFACIYLGTDVRDTLTAKVANFAPHFSEGGPLSEILRRYFALEGTVKELTSVLKGGGVEQKHQDRKGKGKAR